MNTNETSLEAPQNGALWVVQVFGATLFLMSGLAKVGDEQLIQTFTAIGVDQSFRYSTGLIEFASAILLLIPAVSGIVSPCSCSNHDRSHSRASSRCRRKSSSANRTSSYRGCCRLGRKETTLGLIRCNYPKSAREATNSFSEISQDPAIMVKDKKI